MKQNKTQKSKPVVQEAAKKNIPQAATLLSKQKPDYLWPSIIAILAVLLYANTFAHNYVLDDTVAILENQFVQKGFGGIGGLFTVDFWHFSNRSLGYYRPLALITFAVEHQLFGNNPHLSHVINIGLYAFTGFMLCLLLQELFSSYKRIIPFLICALFIAHPIHTEVVANLKSRDEIMSFLGIISVIYIMIRNEGSTSKTYLIVSLIIYYLTFLSKETAITLLALLPACFYFFREKSIPVSLMKVIPFLGVAILFYVQKNAILGELPQQAYFEINNYPYVDAEFPSSMVLFTYFLKLLVFPYPLRYDYSYNLIPAASGTDILAIVGLVIFVGLLFLGYRESMKRSIWGFVIVVFLTCLLPAMAFIWLRGGILAERFLYTATLGFCIAIVFALMKLLKINPEQETNTSDIMMTPMQQFSSLKVVPIICLVIAAVYSFMTISRNPAWKDNLTLFTSDIVHSKASAQNNRHVGHDMLDKAIAEKDSTKRMKMATESIGYLRKAVEINPRFGEVWGDLGRAYYDITYNPDSAIYFFKKCIDATPGAANAYSNLGLVYMRIGKYKTASYYFNKSTIINPTFQEGRQRADELRKASGIDVRVFPYDEDPSGPVGPNTDGTPQPSLSMPNPKPM